MRRHPAPIIFMRTYVWCLRPLRACVFVQGASCMCAVWGVSCRLFEFVFALISLIQLLAVGVHDDQIAHGDTSDPRCKAYSFISEFTLMGSWMCWSIALVLYQLIEYFCLKPAWRIHAVDWMFFLPLLCELVELLVQSMAVRSPLLFGNYLLFAHALREHVVSIHIYLHPLLLPLMMSFAPQAQSCGSGSYLLTC